MNDEYIEYMSKMCGILKKHTKGFNCVEQMLFYHIAADKQGKEYVLTRPRETFLSYKKSGSGRRSISGISNEIGVVSSANLADFLRSLNDNEDFDGDLDYNLITVFDLEECRNGTENSFDVCATKFEKIILDAKSQKRRSNSDQRATASTGATETKIQNIYNQKIISTNGGPLTIYEHVENINLSL